MNFIAGLITGGILMIFVVTGVGTSLNRDWMQKAVDRGYAEWTVDQKTGVSEWRWKEDK